jgi:plastocyanin
MTLSRRLTSAVALLCVTGVLAACGDDDEDSGGGGGSAPAATESGGGGGGASLSLTAAEPGPEKYAFDPAKLTADAGSVTIALDNPSDNKAPHAVEIEGNGVEEVSDTASPGAKAEVTADLEPGEYTFYCPVGDHRSEGMEGTLTVN